MQTLAFYNAVANNDDYHFVSEIKEEQNNKENGCRGNKSKSVLMKLLKLKAVFAIKCSSTRYCIAVFKGFFNGWKNRDSCSKLCSKDGGSGSMLFLCVRLLPDNPNTCIVVVHKPAQLTIIITAQM
jgi:hypothetical protein